MISTAKTQEAHVFERIVPTDTRAIYADKAYDTKANAAGRRTHGIKNQIAKKGAHHIKLTQQDLAANRRKSRLRGGIERVFADWSSGSATGERGIWDWRATNWN